MLHRRAPGPRNRRHGRRARPGPLYHPPPRSHAGDARLPRAWTLAQVPTRPTRLRRRALAVRLDGDPPSRREPLRELRARTGRTASLVALWGTGIAYVDRWQGSHQGQDAVDMGIGPGTRLPVHCTAAGKALLARLPAAEQLDLIAKLRLTRRTPRTIVTKTALRAELERIVAEDGVAVEDEEFSAGRLLPPRW